MLHSSSSSLAANFSQQVSPWLAMGCLSPRQMYQEVRPVPHPTHRATTCLLRICPTQGPRCSDADCCRDCRNHMRLVAAFSLLCSLSFLQHSIPGWPAKVP